VLWRMGSQLRAICGAGRDSIPVTRAPGPFGPRVQRDIRTSFQRDGP
jgi:hypothetical protein